MHPDSLPSSAAGDAGTAQTGAVARYYVFTRDLADAVDGVTILTVGTVWFVAQTTPTSVANGAATWGPWRGDALSPVSWKLVVTESSTNVFDYELDARAAASTSDADWKAILTGHGYGKAHPQHDTGWFEWNANAYQALDPTKLGSGGTTKITYDVHALPATIHADYDPSGASSFTFDVTHEAGGAGQVDVVGQGNVDEDPSNQIENVDVHSAWSTTGAGRADGDVSGGDVPASVGTVHVTECWDTAFDRVYYADTASYEPASGDASACVFQQTIVPIVH